VNITLFEIAQRFVGMKEVVGSSSNPAVLAMLKLDGGWPQDDAVPWCSAFVNYCAWLLRLPRSKSLAARSWLAVGTPIVLAEARPGFDVVIFKRGAGEQPGPDVLNAPGHVALFAGIEEDKVLVLGGNQGDSVSLARFSVATVLGVRRLHSDA
jgi:uncharacterized protein (TIGR02594 family)